MICTKFKTFLLAVFALLSVATTCYAEPQPLLTRHVHEEAFNGQARRVGRLPAEQSMHFEIVLPLRNQPELDTLLNQLYDHTSPSYRHFLTVEDFTTRFGPTQKDYDAVIAFAKANGLEVASTSRNRMNVSVRGTVANIEKALHVTMAVYQHPTENRTFYSPDHEPTVDLPFPLWHIAGLENFSLPRPLPRRSDLKVQSNAFTGSGPSYSFLGSDMRAAYYGGTALDGTGQSVGLLEFTGIELSDVNQYYHNVGQTLNTPITLVSTDGTSVDCYSSNGCRDAEPVLDVTQVLGMAPNLSSLVVYIGSNDLALYNAMATARPLNAQLSCSWFYGPADPASADPYFEEFAAQGQSFFVAAGDNGAWNSTALHYPADDPFVTSVGGTDLTTQYPGGPWVSESAWVDTGGGISPAGFAQPFWQAGVVYNGCSSCSEIYRNGPDVAASANTNFYVCADQIGCYENYGGTSFAAPMWAGYMALANQAAAASNNPPVGFINPALYYFGFGSVYNSYFHDITSGSNNLYAATPGFDLVTGWGSPNGQNLAYALAVDPGFQLNASPASISVAQGSSATSTINAVFSAFSQLVPLGTTGLPAGVSASFNHAFVEPGLTSSIITFAVSSSAVPGTYPITVTGTSSPFTGSTTVMLTVTQVVPSFSLSVSPTTMSVIRGGSGSAAITTTISGSFSSGITLSASGQGSGTTVTFTHSPIPAPGAGTSTMTVRVGSRATLGNRTITITASGGGMTRSKTVTLNVPR